jgi:hypothetical protein
MMYASSPVVPAEAGTHGHDRPEAETAPSSMGPGFRRDDEGKQIP